MIRNEEKIHRTPDVKTKRFRISAFAPLYGDVEDDSVGFGYTKYACNVNISDGRIVRSAGVAQAKVNDHLFPSTFSVGTAVADGTIFKRYDYSTGNWDHRVVYLDSDGDVYEARIGTSSALTQLNVSRSVFKKFLHYHYNNKDALLLFDAELGKIELYDGTTIVSGNTPKLTDACVYNDKVYGVENVGYNRLRFSATNDPFDWTTSESGAGSVYFSDEGGVLRRVVPCGENLYVFRDYAVYKLTAYKGVKDYTLTKIFSAAEKICPQTVACWSNQVFFLAEKGLYAIEGNNVKSVWRAEFSMIKDPSHATAVCHNGAYYLAAKFVTDGGTVGEEAQCTYNNGIMVMMIGSGGNVELVRGVDVKRFVPCDIDGKGYMFLVNGNGYRCLHMSMLTDDGKIYGTNAEKRWRSPEKLLTHLGEDVTIRKVHVQSASNITVKVIVDGRTHEFAVTGSTKTSSFAVNDRGERLQIVLTGTADHFSPRGFEVEYETTERRQYGAN